MDDDQQFCLRWNNHQSTLISVFDTLLENGTLVDCTLAAEGKFLKAHKVVLSACSPYFAVRPLMTDLSLNLIINSFCSLMQALLSQQYDKHPIFILKDVKFQELRAMMDYMYRGEVNISQDQLAALLKAAESLQIKGLSDNRSSSAAPSQQKQAQNEAAATKSLVAPVVPANKVKLIIKNEISWMCFKLVCFPGIGLNDRKQKAFEVGYIRIRCIRISGRLRQPYVKET